ncbi:MAG: YaiI/YqxD family protein [Xanthomonadales bacterium]|nr:YaiI/YqxD family protein [Xanthomonadales bacterium]
MGPGQIWVDADACPRAVKDILFRAAERVGIAVTLVANQPLSVPRSSHISSVQVAAGFDVADNYIVKQAQPGDLCITADIPLAAELLQQGCQALNPRGELYTEDNIRQRLNMRDFMDTLRASGIDTGGPAAYGQADKQRFANQLDRLLAKRISPGSRNPSPE